MSAKAATLEAKILRAYQHYLASRGFRSGTDFAPWDRDVIRSWESTRGNAFLEGFLLKNPEFRVHRDAVIHLVDHDIDLCYRISP